LDFHIFRAEKATNLAPDTEFGVKLSQNGVEQVLYLSFSFSLFFFFFLPCQFPFTFVLFILDQERF